MEILSHSSYSDVHGFGGEHVFTPEEICNSLRLLYDFMSAANCSEDRFVSSTLGDKLTWNVKAKSLEPLG